MGQPALRTEEVNAGNGDDDGGDEERGGGDWQEESRPAGVEEARGGDGRGKGHDQRDHGGETRGDKGVGGELKEFRGGEEIGFGSAGEARGREEQSARNDKEGCTPAPEDNDGSNAAPHRGACGRLRRPT